MLKKRHLAIVALCTAIVTIFFYNAFIVLTDDDFGSSDPVSKAKKIIVSDYVNPLTEEQIKELDDAAISAMVAKLEDPYSRYLDREALTRYEEDTEEDYVGIGMQVLFDFEENAIVVTAPYDNSPAQRSGILPGDKIIEVDGMKVSKDTYEEIISHIRGKGAKEGAIVNVKLLRKDEQEPLNFEIKREQVDVQTVSFKKIGDVGYIRVAEFINRTKDEFRAATETLKDMDAKAVIIDLRNNPGGYAHTVISMCDMLLPKGVIAYLEDNDGNKEYFHSDEEELGLPMAILINGGTASASELLAGSVQAYGLATVVGEKSYGKAVGQSPYSLSEDTALYLTNSRYFTPKGECIDKRGIIPDVEVGLSDEKLTRLTLLETEEDDQLMAALEILNK